MSIVLVGILWGATGCLHRPGHPDLSLVSESEYRSLVEKQTEKSQLYEGFANVLDVRATLLSEKLQMAQLDQKARNFQWNPTQYAEEKQKLSQILNKETQIFVSFFVPDRKHDDLHKKNSQWKIFFDYEGRRFEGRAEKLKWILAEAQALYPHHTRWGTPYLLRFDISTLNLKPGSSPKLTLTGPVAGTVLTLPVQ